MNLEKFKQAIEGQKTIRLTHKMARGDGYVTVNRKVEVSDLTVGESGLIEYTCYLAGVCRHVLARVDDVIKVKSVMTCLLYTSPSPRDKRQSRMPSSA